MTQSRPFHLPFAAVGVTYYFACRRWLSRDEEDGLIERDLFPGEEEAESGDEAVQYSAEVYTSDVEGASTDADVSLVLFGELGSTGPQNLNVSSCAAMRFACCVLLCHGMWYSAVLCHAEPRREKCARLRYHGECL